MRIDVVRAALRIVLEHEHDGALPERTPRQRFDQSAKREIVVRHVRSWRRLPCLRSGRVVVRQTDKFECWHLSGPHKILELLEPDLYPHLIGNVQAPSRIR